MRQRYPQTCVSSGTGSGDVYGRLFLPVIKSRDRVCREQWSRARKRCCCCFWSGEKSKVLHLVLDLCIMIVLHRRCIGRSHGGRLVSLTMCLVDKGIGPTPFPGNGSKCIFHSCLSSHSLTARKYFDSRADPNPCFPPSCSKSVSLFADTVSVDVKEKGSHSIPHPC